MIAFFKLVISILQKVNGNNKLKKENKLKFIYFNFYTLLPHCCGARNLFSAVLCVAVHFSAALTASVVKSTLTLLFLLDSQTTIESMLLMCSTLSGTWPLDQSLGSSRFTVSMWQEVTQVGICHVVLRSQSCEIKPTRQRTTRTWTLIRSSLVLELCQRYV